MPSRLTQNKFGTSVFNIKILALILAVLKCFSKVETKRCWHYVHLKLMLHRCWRTRCQGILFFAEFSFEHALINNVDANVQAMNKLDQVKQHKQPFIFICIYKNLSKQKTLMTSLNLADAVVKNQVLWMILKTVSFIPLDDIWPCNSCIRC